MVMGTKNAATVVQNAYTKAAKAIHSLLHKRSFANLLANFIDECWTDHSPLTWVKHTSGKVPVSQFIIDTLSMVDYEMNYFQGKDNVIRDS